ncbi:DeoR/GlpR family DNA-binding transcription regulator [Collinsella sp. AGMB00827]|uniref:DeoR/GlpR family DNA-binding transcription regulator n=1 Tax=Collinsella ureilytica TaxID=2869515 RepID=A0ABS7MLX3_9ACTN|nr:DeoR/GlpR family DNA-binding transcription regulator [Collinsella urealyticum]MBY4798369.1 DeoR/GlpR family DNA-binding transcription regulator [Collinsella urealyticum]
MIPYERRELVIEQLHEADLLHLDDLQELLPDVSVSTLRRDLKELEREGRVEILSGGGVKLKLRTVSHERGIQVASALHAAEKEQIAKRASAEISDGDTVYVDSGSSGTMLLAQLLDRDVTIYTGNGSACWVTGDMRARIIVIGGSFNPHTSSMTGPIAEAILSEVYFDKAFLGVNAVSVERGVTNPSYDEASKKRIVRKNSNATYVLCDSSKFHQVSNVKVFDLEGLTLISDTFDARLSKAVRILTPEN